MTKPGELIPYFYEENMKLTWVRTSTLIVWVLVNERNNIIPQATISSEVITVQVITPRWRLNPGTRLNHSSSSKGKKEKSRAIPVAGPGLGTLHIQTHTSEYL